MTILDKYKWGRKPRTNYNQRVTPEDQRRALVEGLRAQVKMYTNNTQEELITNARGKQVEVTRSFTQRGDGTYAVQIKYGNYVLGLGANNAIIVAEADLKQTLEQLVEDAEAGAFDDILHKKLIKAGKLAA